jgi:signal transduction histidine kinase
LSRSELRDHLPRFFDEILAALRAGEGPETPTAGEAGASTAHGEQRLRVGFDLAGVLREYQILSECILDEAEAAGGHFSVRTLRRVQALLEAGRIEAGSAYIERRDMEMTRAHSQHVAFVAHELRSPLMSAFLAVAALRKSGRVEDEWALGMLSRNLNALRELIDQVLTADRLAGQISADREAFDLSSLLQQLAAEA